MKRGKIRAEKFSNHINVLRIQKGIFLFTSFFDLYSFIFSLQVYFEYGSIYSGGSLEKMSNNLIYNSGFVVKVYCSDGKHIRSFKNTT